MMPIRWQLPADSLRVSVMATQAIALASIVAIGITVRGAGLPVSVWYPLKAGAVFIGIMGVALQRLRRHHPHESFGPANQVTTLRSTLVALAAALVGEGPDPAGAGFAVVISVLATALDGLDGWLARRTRMATSFGARFDMEIDALLIQVLALLAWQFGKAGVWVILSGLMRYLFLLAGWWWARLRRPLFESIRRRSICVVQIGGLLVALWPAVTPPLSSLISGIALAALCYSFAVDVEWLWRH